MTALEKRYIVYLIVSALVVIGVCTPGSPLSVRAATVSALQSGAAASQKRPPVADRTTPIIQEMTPAQRQHSLLFNEFSTRVRLLDEMLNLNSFVDRVAADPKPTTDIAAELRCAADDVFVGTVESSQSWPTADGTFLFTEYSIRITEDVANLTEPISPGTVITIVRPGGSMRIEEQTITARTTDAPPLITGVSYLFFAKRVVATGAYRSAHHNGTFLVADSSIKSLRSVPAFEGDLASGTRKDLFVNAVRAGGPCK